MSNYRRQLSGVPQYLHDRIVWVADEYRTNELSLQTGGYRVIVCYQKGKTLGYDKIKRPPAYVKQIWEKDITRIYVDYETWDEDDQLEELKKHVSCIYVENKDEDSDNYGKFQKLWDSSTANSLPWNKTKNSAKKPYNSYKPYDYGGYKKYGTKKYYRRY